MELAKAYQRFRRCERAAVELENCKSHAEFEEYWLDFLLHSNGVYTQIEQASKATPQDRQWFGAKKRERKQDELLQYLYQARHSDEHSLERVTKLKQGSLEIGKAIPGHSTSMLINSTPNGGFTVKATDGKPVAIGVNPSTTILSSVTARGGVVYGPPTMHKDQPLKNNHPTKVAALMVAHLRSLLEEAGKRA